MVIFKEKMYADWIEARASIVAPPPIVPESTATAVLDDPPAIERARMPVEARGEAALTLDTTGADAGPAPAPVKRVSLAEKWRPRHLADIVGQPEAVAALQCFVADPYPTAFVLAGGTGTGKTSAAWALAAELGCDVDATPPEWGGVYTIASGEHTADSLRDLWPGLWTRPMAGSGMKVLIVNEVEHLNNQVERIWLDRLEDLPPRTVIIFTSNAVETLPARFVDRCIGGVITFEASVSRLGADARALAGRIWQAEVGGEIPADVLEKVMARAVQQGRLSFRRIVQALVPLVAQKGKV